MITTTGKLVIIDLGMPTVRYLWNGVAIIGVIRVFVYRNGSLVITVADKSIVQVNEMKINGIEVKEAK
ncbi:MAG: hypothetical protein JHC33_01010 [Ignisphaera sp.]|nr:hypothetical protein [Ignisphaera sp.]